MRAIFYTGEKSERILIKDDQFHHLKNVLRIKNNEEVLLLNGKGLKALAVVVSVNKKDIELSLSEWHEFDLKEGIELAIGIPKKENFEDICRVAIELGISKIFAVRCDYSQWSFEESERLQKILISSLLQSNNLFLPEIVPVENVENLLKLDKKVIPMDLAVGKTPENIVLAETILFIGPEAGFSERERSMFKDIEVLHIKGPILRATSAVPTGIGYLKGYTV